MIVALSWLSEVTFMPENSAPQTTRIPHELDEKITYIHDKESKRAATEKRKTPSRSEILRMLLELGVEAYYDREAAK